MSSLFGGGAKSSPSMPPVIQYVMEPEPARAPLPDPAGDEAKELAAAEREKKRRAGLMARGAAATVLTGGMGLEDAAPVKRKQLFGE